MGLESLVASGVALADRITASLQGTVEHHVFKELDGRGKPVHWEPHDNVQAVITYGQARASSCGGCRRTRRSSWVAASRHPSVIGRPWCLDSASA